MKINYEFGSDNHSGVHENIMKEIKSVNAGFSLAYGEDYYTKKAIEQFKKIFGEYIDVYFVGNGTAANILGLKSVTNSFNSIICPTTAHLNVHECCGPEKFLGCKIETIETSDGKLTPNLIEPHIVGIGDVHMAQPKVVSITQVSELGTVYTPKEIKNLSNFVHKNDMLLHMDGARLCNAAAYLNSDLNEITGKAGVDILSFGGTKNGMMFGDAVVFFDKKLAKNFEFYRKQGMHLTSKMRYISAQFNAFFDNDLWLENAKHANKMAKILYEEIKDIKNIEITQIVQGNAVFAKFDKKFNKELLKKYFFHVFDEKENIVRLMCSFNTTEKDIFDFSSEIKKVLS